jgi:hypothetical protein
VEITDLASHMPGEVCRYEATCKDRDIAEIAHLFLARRKARRYRPPYRDRDVAEGVSLLVHARRKAFAKATSR